MYGELDRMKNVEFNGFTHVEELKTDLPVFTLREPSVEEWNEKAKRRNIGVFISEFHKFPKSYGEVRSWMDSLAEKNKIHIAGNDTDLDKIAN